MSRRPRWFGCMLVVSLLGCECSVPEHIDDTGPTDAGPARFDAPGSDVGSLEDGGPPTDAPFALCFVGGSGGGGSVTVGEAISATGCSTAVVRTLSDQLVEEINCLVPDAMARIDAIPGLTLNSAALPWLQSPAAMGLRAATAERPGLSTNSTLRTLPQQLMLYQWYVRGRCGITLAARPGTSPHESGLAIDTSAYSAYRTVLERHGFRWHGAGDLPHFDYVAGGISLPGQSVRAFQRLWNRNHPEDRIAEDGDYGPQTEARLLRAPTEGFAIGASCDAPMTPELAIDWVIEGGHYIFTAMPSTEAVRVVYAMDGVDFGEGVRASGFRLDGGPCMDGRGRVLRARAYSAGGALVAERSGWLEARALDAIYVRAQAGTAFEIGLERPSPTVASIEVRADGVLLTDSVSMTSRSTRRAVRTTFTTLGTRTLEVRAFDAAGSMITSRMIAVPLEVRP